MKVIWNNKTIAQADKKDLAYIEGNWYFPPSATKKEYFTKSPTPYTCPWKGKCQYFNVGDKHTTSKDAAWSYPKPLPGAIKIVKKDFSGYVAFDKNKVQVVED